MKKKILLLMVLALTLGTMQSCEDDEAKKIEATSVSLDKESLTIVEGETASLVASVLPADAADISLIWTSEHTEVATVSKEGVISAIKAGETSIKVEHANGISAVCKLIVTEKESEHITMLKSSEFGWKAVYAGQKNSFGAHNYIFKFTANDVITLSDFSLFTNQEACEYTVEENTLVFGENSPLRKYFVLEVDDVNNMMIDCVFSIEKVNETTIKLTGDTFNTVLILEKAKEGDANLIEVCKAQGAKLVTFGESNTEEKFFKILKLTGAVEKLIEVDFAAWIYTEDYCTMSVQYVQDKKVVSDTLQYYYTSKGFNLYKPYSIGGNEISNFEYDEATKAFKLVDATGVEGVFTFSDERAYPRVGIGAEFMSKSHQIIGMANSTLAMEVMKDGAHCNFMMGGEVGIFIDYVKDGETLNSIMLRNDDDGIVTLDMKWSIKGEDLLVAEIIDKAAYDVLTDAEKALVDYFVNGFYILPYNPIMGYDTYLLVGKSNSSMALGAFMVDTKAK